MTHPYTSVSIYVNYTHSNPNTPPHAQIHPPTLPHTCTHPHTRTLMHIRMLSHTHTHTHTCTRRKMQKDADKEVTKGRHMQRLCVFVPIPLVHLTLVYTSVRGRGRVTLQHTRICDMISLFCNVLEYVT